jgi:hypothetical protein
MGRLQRAKGEIRKFLKSGQSSSEEVGTSASVQTEPQTQNTGGVASAASTSLQTQKSDHEM